MDTQTLEHINRIIERLSERLDNAEKVRDQNINAIWELEARLNRLEDRIEGLERIVGQ